MSKADNILVNSLFEKLKEKKISVPKFSEATGIPKDRVYKWKYEGTSPKSEDEKTIREWLNMEKAPRENGATSKNAPVSDFKPQHAPDYRDDIIALLKEKSNSEARKTLQYLEVNNALLKATVQVLAKIQASLDKRKLKDVQIEMNNLIEQHLQALRKDGT